jgi:uncharacterized membrane protein
MAPGLPTPRRDCGAIARGSARTLLLAALAGGGYLAYISLSGGGVAGCGPGSGCDRVLSSRWAYWLGLPVSLPALVVYGGVLGVSFGLGPNRGDAVGRRCRLAVVAGAVLIFAAAIWFAALQDLVIGTWCRFCLATHASAVVAAALLFREVVRRRPSDDSGGWGRWGVALGLVGAAALIGGQFAVRPRRFAVRALAAGIPSGASELRLDGGRVVLDPDRVPRIGPAGAPTVVVALFDYTCPHCRRMHPLLEAAVARSGGRLAVLLLPVPLEAECNPMIQETAPENLDACAYARLSLAVWFARPAAFRAFDEALMGGERLPSLGQARVRAEALVGRSLLDQVERDPAVARQIDADVRLYIAMSRSLRTSRLPQLIFADAASSGEVDDAAALAQLIGQHTPFAVR